MPKRRIRTKTWKPACEQPRKVVKGARALRNETRLKVRQPLAALKISSPEPAALKAVEYMADIIKEEINVKEVQTSADISELVTREAKPDFKKLGPRFGKSMKDVAAAIRNWQESDIAILQQQGHLRYQHRWRQS